MGLQLPLFFIAAALSAAASSQWTVTRGDTCPAGPVGSCKIFSCRSSRGPTVCRDGSCMCIDGYCQYPENQINILPRRCRAQVPDSSCNLFGMCWKGGLLSTTCVSGRCLCRTGMHIGSDGKCHSGWHPKSTQCNKDTSGTCSFFGCDWSRKAHCVSGKCLCDKTNCAEGGKCVPPWQLGQTSAPTNDITSQLYLYATNATMEDDSLSLPSEITSEEDWAVAVNAFGAIALVALPLIMASGGMFVFHRRRLSHRGVGVNKRSLLNGETEHSLVTN